MRLQQTAIFSISHRKDMHFVTLFQLFVLFVAAFWRRSCSPVHGPTLVEWDTTLIDGYESIVHSLPSFARKIAKTLSIVSDNGSFDCFACRMGVKTMHFIVRSGASEDDVGFWASKLCIKFGVSTDRVCRGLCNAMKKEVFYVFSHANLDPGYVCSSILEQDCGTSNEPEDKWTVVLPDVTKPTVAPVLPPKPESPSLRVLHIADVHLDPLYAVGTRTDCGEFLCCRNDDGNPVTPQMGAGKWGDYRKCDTPVRSFESLLVQIAKTHELDYILMTGDEPPHDIWNQTEKGHLAIIDKVSEMLQIHFPSTPVFSSVGNHEGIPVNSFPTPAVSHVATMDWLYEAFNRTWMRWLPPTASATILQGGFYSAPVYPGFRIISLNMNFCNNLNWWLLLNTTDPLGQLQWLVAQLQDAENRGDKVHIIGHIPPGNNDCMRTWSFNYYRIINRYESTVRGQFFGHTHMDEFEVFYDVSDGAAKPRPTNVAYIAPSVTPYNSANPSYRIYTVDGKHPGSTWAVLDHETYFANLTEANLNGSLNWYLLYKAKVAYNLTSLQPNDWDELVGRLQTNDWLFRLFYRHYHRASEAFPKCDTEQCKTKLLCSLRSGRSNDPSHCMTSG